MSQDKRFASYAEALIESKNLQRRTILEIAGRILSEEGPQALTMRSVAKKLGTSTTVLYTMFGGKDGLAEGLFVEGFHRLQQAFDTVPTDLDPVTRVLALGQAYFAHAVENPNSYGIMFLNVIPGFTPSPAAFGVGSRTFAVFEEAVARCLEVGVLPKANVRELTLALWSAGHGVASLHLAGRIRNPSTLQPDAELAATVYRTTFGGLVAGLQAGHVPSVPGFETGGLDKEEREV